jgi:hypothetical protein
MEKLPCEDSMSIWQERAQCDFLAARWNAPLIISETTKSLRAGVPSPLNRMTTNQGRSVCWKRSEDHESNCEHFSQPRLRDFR